MKVFITALTVCIVIIAILLIIIALFLLQIASISKQLSEHMDMETNTDIRLDIFTGPFTRLRDVINLYIDMRRRERAEIKRQEMKRKEFITNISHDIRTPVTSIAGYFQLLIQTEDKAKQKEYADIILGRLTRFRDLLEEFFDYSKIESEDSKPKADRVDIKRIISDSLFLYYNEIEEKFGSPMIDFGSGEYHVFGDKKDIERICQNVIKNALVHGREKFSVAVYTREDYVYASFANIPAGELPKDIDRVFERSFKGEESRSEITGAGLGLCIVKELVLKYGGNATAALDNGEFKLTIGLKRMK